MRGSRSFLKAEGWEDWRALETDERKGIPAPPAQKPCPEGSQLVPLVPFQDITLGKAPLIGVMKRRRSRRRFTEAPLSLEELSFLLWATQGVREPGVSAFRTVPSAGARHPFETYLAVARVTGLERGLYRYLPLEHCLALLRREPDASGACIEGAPGRAFVRAAAVTFLWTVVPYRTEWRYSHLAHRLIALDAGHVCQNLYLASEAIDAGTCAVGAFEQKQMDAFLGVDGEEEFVIHLAAVGKI